MDALAALMVMPRARFLLVEVKHAGRTCRSDDIIRPQR